MITESQLKEMEERANAATPGPWRFSDTACNSIRSETAKEEIIGTVSVPYEWEHEWTASDEDIRFITHAREDLPALIAEIRRLREALEFYAEPSNWVSRSGKIGICPIDTDDRESIGNGEYPWAGGKRARQALGIEK